MKNTNNKLLDFLYTILGPYKSYAGEEYYFQCALCSRKDNKKKLAIKLDKDDAERFQHWHCWRDNGHRGSNLVSLLKRIAVNPQKIDELKSILKSYGATYDINDVKNVFYHTVAEKEKVSISLPEEFHLFLDVDMKDIEYSHALAYLQSRNITASDIIKNNIGYCDSGKYHGYIILPSYDKEMNLNYFATRSYYIKEGYMRHKNPQASKNIIFNELHISWKYPITVCEGVFDALAIRRNAIPLLGKTINDALMLKIQEEKVKEIYICLDKDAMKQSISYIEQFMNNGVIVYFVNLPGKDPSQIGFKDMTLLIKQAKPVEFEDLLRLKLSF